MRGGWALFKKGTPFSSSASGTASLHEILAKVYPEVEWDPSRFAEVSGVPVRYWQDHNLLLALGKVEKQLGITQVGRNLKIDVADKSFSQRIGTQ